MSPTIENYTRTFIRRVFIALALFIFHGAPVQAEVKVLYVKPEQTDSAIEAVHGPNLAVYDPQATPKHRLFLFIDGTGGKATSSLALDRIFAGWGYHAVSLDYENNVLTASMVHSTDPTVFDRYRKAIVTGAPVSGQIKVDPANSIINRVQKLLVYLAIHDPKGGWDEFVKGKKPVWKRIIVAGHSQGSGHAAYIGKMFKVDRVLIFSGPQDYLDDLHQPAPWQGGKSATPPSHFFAFLSRNDPYNVTNQEANCMLLMHQPKLKALTVNPSQPVQGNYQILINDFPRKGAHGSTISPQFTNVWQYMVTENDK